MHTLQRQKIFKISKKIWGIILSLLVLLIGLDLIKHVLVGWLHQEFLNNFFISPSKSFFISYLMTEITMSWSPIAGAFISLWNTLNIGIQNLAAIVMWTRGWVNSFLLITWLLMLFKWKSLRRSLWITVIQFFVTLSTTLLAGVFLFPLLHLKILGNISETISQWLVIHSTLEKLIWPITTLIKIHITHNFSILIIGLIALWWGLFLFDKSFSFLKEKENKEILEKFENSKTAFFSGFIITALTLSLSISVTILLPLYIRKLIDRKLLVAYILWANISTLFDTLFLWAITQSTIGIQVVLSFLIAVTISVGIYLLIFKYYRKTIWHLTDHILKNKYRFLTFTIIAMVIPLFFLL